MGSTSNVIGKIKLPGTHTHLIRFRRGFRDSQGSMLPSEDQKREAAELGSDEAEKGLKTNILKEKRGTWKEGIIETGNRKKWLCVSSTMGITERDEATTSQQGCKTMERIIQHRRSIPCRRLVIRGEIFTQQAKKITALGLAMPLLRIKQKKI